MLNDHAKFRGLIITHPPTMHAVKVAALLIASHSGQKETLFCFSKFLRGMQYNITPFF